MDTFHIETITTDSQDTRHAETAILDSSIYGIDFGARDALAIHGAEGAISKRSLRLPRVKGGKTTAQEFILVAEALLRGDEHRPAGDIVVESATIGASGCEVGDVLDLLKRVPNRRIYTISCRAVKNYRADHKLGWDKGARYAKDGAPPPVVLTLEEQAEVHVKDAEIIYRIATESPARLRHWTKPPEEIQRDYTSVRPMDKRGYNDHMSEFFMAMLPDYTSLPEELRDVTGNGKDYSRAFVMPFAMASDESFLNEGPVEKRRGRYERIIGLYDHGYPSFYRRATIVWVQKNAKRLANVTRMSEVSPDVRKQAWRITSRQIRHFFHLTMEHQNR